MYRIRANDEPTYATLMYEPMWYRLGSQRGKGTILLRTSEFNLQRSQNSLLSRTMTMESSFPCRPKASLRTKCLGRRRIFYQGPPGPGEGMKFTQGTMRIVHFLSPHLQESDIDGVHALSPCSGHDTKITHILFPIRIMQCYPESHWAPSLPCTPIHAIPFHLISSHDQNSMRAISLGSLCSVNQERIKDVSYAVSSSSRAEILGVYHNLAWWEVKVTWTSSRSVFRYSYRCMVTD